MKNFLLFMIVLLTSNAYATEDNLMSPDPMTIINLNEIKQNHATIYTSFPGKRSANCKLILRARNSFDITRFFDFFDFEGLTAISSYPDTRIPGAIIFKLEAGSEHDGFKITTKDGRSIGENVTSALGPFDSAGVSLGICSKLPPL